MGYRWGELESLFLMPVKKGGEDCEAIARKRFSLPPYDHLAMEAKVILGADKSGMLKAVTVSV